MLKFKAGLKKNFVRCQMVERLMIFHFKLETDFPMKFILHSIINIMN